MANELGITFEDQDFLDVSINEEGEYSLNEETSEGENKQEEEREKKETKAPVVPEGEYLEVEDSELPEDVEEEITEEEQEIENTEVPEGNVLIAFAKELQDQGILSELPKESLEGIESFEDLSSIIQDNLSGVVESWKSEYQKNIIDNLINKGLIKAEDVVTRKGVDYSEEDIKNSEDIQKSVISEFLKEKGLSDKKIQKFIDNSVDLEEDALEYFEDLKKVKEEKETQYLEQVKQQEEAKKKAFEETDKGWKDYIKDTKEFVPGKKINKQFKDEVYTNIVPTINKINQNLKKYAPILSFLDKYNVLDEGMQAVIENKNPKKTVNTFEKLLKSQGGVTRSQGNDSLKNALKYSLGKK